MEVKQWTLETASTRLVAREKSRQRATTLTRSYDPLIRLALDNIG